jgi:hypothetical protein
MWKLNHRIKYRILLLYSWLILKELRINLESDKIMLRIGSGEKLERHKHNVTFDRFSENEGGCSERPTGFQQIRLHITGFTEGVGKEEYLLCMPIER